MIINSYMFVRTTFDAERFLSATGNKYKYISQKPYYDAKGKTGSTGTILTLQILEDTTDYGVNPKTGLKRDNNVLQTFDVTILNGETSVNLSKGDCISLKGYDSKHSYVIGYSLLLRFKGYKKIDSEEFDLNG